MKLIFSRNERRDWCRKVYPGGECWATGWAEAEGKTLDAEALAGFFSRNLERDFEISALEGLAGSYALVGRCGDRIMLAADPVRTIPLVYSVENEAVKVADDLSLLGPTVDALSAVSAAEFLAAGFVTGDNTLYRNISGVQAGEVVLFEGGVPCRIDVYTYQCTYDAQEGQETLIRAHDMAVFKAFERMLASIGNRQIVVPLSGGLDSRLVASTLKRMGRENVLCLTYGREGGVEDGPSRDVAKMLGYERLFLPYHPKDLRKALRGSDMEAFRHFGSCGISSPHLDDWLALKLLRGSGRVDSDAVFVPGHTGDFISGGHLKHVFDPEHNGNQGDFGQAMVVKHYSLWAEHIKDPEVREAVLSRLSAALDGVPLDTAEDMAAAYELWEWRERQAKFIVNAVRSLEWHGFLWRVPLWDRAVMDFWKRVPLRLKHEKFLYRKALEANDEIGVFQGAALPEPWDRSAALARVRRKQANPRRRAKEYVFRLPVLSRLRERHIRTRRLAREYDRHPLGIAQLWEREEYLGRDPDKRHYQAMLTREYLASLGWPGQR